MEYGTCMFYKSIFCLILKTVEIGPLFDIYCKTVSEKSEILVKKYPHANIGSLNIPLCGKG